jgi:hypothetical protein
MKTAMLLPTLVFGLTLTGATAVQAMPVAALEQAEPATTTPVYHRGYPHSRARITVYPRRYYRAVPYFDDYSHYYPAVRGFEDYNPVPRGNMRGCTVDLGYGRYESCDK